MTTAPITRQAILEREFLEIRASIVQLAAALDRVERAEGQGDDDPRLAQIDQALAVLRERRTDRAAQVLMRFSRPYDPQWRSRGE